VATGLVRRFGQTEFVAFVAVYDASVLYPSTTRDLLIRIAQAGLVHARWTDAILDEVFTSLIKNRPDLDPERLSRTRELMGRSIRDVLVVGCEPLINALELPDPDDRHVLAAAIRARAQLIVTHNLRDFPAESLERWDVEAVGPDSFVRAQIDLDRDLVVAAVVRIADSWRKPPGTPRDVLSRLEREGLVESAAALRD
jgi:predicted nucleic acid-binding protein